MLLSVSVLLSAEVLVAALFPQAATLSATAVASNSIRPFFFLIRTPFSK
jgi:hypothetical protein